MTFPNHVIGGVVITGVFASIMDVNILESPVMLGACVLGSVLPDIDHTRSPIGFACYPLARWLNRRFGHRTITHSLFFFLLLILLSATLETVFLESKKLTLVFGIGYASHLLLDMMTVQGVPLYYPFWKNPCVVPGKASMRFRTGKGKSEVMIFGFFTIALLMLQPLMDKGFWTSYNQAFGTPKHLASEFQRSSELLHVRFDLKEGTEKVSRRGFVVEASEHQFVMIDEYENSLEKLDAQFVTNVRPEHLPKRLTFERVSFAMITEDSLNSLLRFRHLRSIAIAANQSFRANLDNFMTKQKQFSGEYYSNLQVEFVKEEFLKKEFRKFTNPNISRLRSRLQRIQDENTEAAHEQARIGERISVIESDLSSADVQQRQFLLEELDELRKKTKSVDRSKEAELKAEIAYLLQSDKLKNQETFEAVKEHNARKPQDPFFSGTIELIKIEDEEFDFPTSMSVTDRIWDML